MRYSDSSSPHMRRDLGRRAGETMRVTMDTLSKREPDIDVRKVGAPAVDTPTRRNESGTTDRKTLWKAAIKVPMYTVALSPMVVATACCYYDHGVVSWTTLAMLLGAGVAIIAWLNVSNDVFDFETGIDKNKRESVVNLLGGDRRARNTGMLIAQLFLLVGLLLLIGVCYVPQAKAFDWTPLVLILFAVGWGYSYQGPPFRLGYYGVGEPICFMTWFISTCAAYYAQAPSADARSIEQGLRYLWSQLGPRANSSLMLGALQVSTVTTIILFCSHFHQEKDDLAAGKRSPIVRLGLYKACMVLTVACAFLHVCALAGTLYRDYLVWPFVIVTIATLPATRDLILFAWTNYAEPEKIRPLKYYAVVLNFCYSMVLSAAMILTRKYLIQ
ncbi:2-carboxy-1,4-naphthoquinone phytyltransferase [Porphyridium purpureum]|uniref:2-carboxy-1,4-naphthoquinone phytyltransferase n=1 Tax=Porphyridium purpureum TaxID=35688 RepID=A0A5J4Z5A9_PORPP|nr:2-carboxy-1,4-naphthoquinone phytyltransferase [Porphyridium purpureum]|eukprot:POR3157..scf295_1